MLRCNGGKTDENGICSKHVQDNFGEARHKIKVYKEAAPSAYVTKITKYTRSEIKGTAYNQGF